jgi:hypothetical protein
MEVQQVSKEKSGHEYTDSQHAKFTIKWLRENSIDIDAFYVMKVKDLISLYRKLERTKFIKKEQL